MSNAVKNFFFQDDISISQEDYDFFVKYIKDHFEVKYVDLTIQELQQHSRFDNTFTVDFLKTLNHLKLNIIDYIGKFSINHVCTPRGDNRLRDKRGRIYYVMSTEVSTKRQTACVKIEVLSSHTVVTKIENFFYSNKNKLANLPTYIHRAMRQSLVYAKQEDRGELPTDEVDMSEE